MALQSIERLAKLIGKINGVGAKSAFRYAMQLFYSSDDYIHAFSEALLDLKKGVRLCARCKNLSSEELCEVCRDDRRDGSLVCVVEKYSDLLAIESGGDYEGAYHVLHGLISPLRGVSHEDIYLSSLFERIEAGGIKEVIFAFDSGLDSDATISYISRRLSGTSVLLSKISYGISLGSDIESADPKSLSRSISGRSVIS